MDNYNYPEGSDTPNAPWNEKEPMTKVCPECEGVQEQLSGCCGARIDSDILICSDCRDHSTIYVCEECSGDGEVEMTHEEVAEHEANVRCMKQHGFVP